MKPKHLPGPAMTLGNMREFDVQRLALVSQKSYIVYAQRDKAA
jgi:hypothetical protein